MKHFDDENQLNENNEIKIAYREDEHGEKIKPNFY